MIRTNEAARGRGKQATVHCAELTTGEYAISGCSNRATRSVNDPAAVAFQQRAISELLARPHASGGGFGVIVSATQLPAARELAREVFGIDWDESSRLDQESVLSVFLGAHR